MRISTLFHLWRNLGTRWLWFRLRYWLRLRTGNLRRRMPCKSWDETPDVKVNESALKFISKFNSNTFQSLLSFVQQGAEANNGVIQDAHDIQNGQFTFFEYHKKQINYPPDWFKNYFTDDCAPADVHWSQISDFGYGDIKSRMGTQPLFMGLHVSARVCPYG